MSTALVKIEEALKTDVVVAASGVAATIETFNPKTMKDAETAALTDAMRVLGLAKKKLEGDQRDMLAPFKAGMDGIRAAFAKVLDPISKAFDRAKQIEGQRREYAAAEARRVADEERRRNAAAAARAAATGGPAPPPADVEIKPIQNVSRGGLGAAVGTKMLVVELKDALALAQAYPHLLRLDEAGAKTELRALWLRDPDANLPGVAHHYKTGISSR